MTTLSHPAARVAGRGRRRAPCRPTFGFTLVELLVVIGIIALLISILLPALGAARRQGRAVKCLASLRELGNAFQMYSIEFKGYWPVAVHATGNTQFPTAVEMRWPDLIARYVTKATDIQKYDDINKVRQNSVIWGCPEWAKALENDDTTLSDKVRVGYGMNPYPMYFDDFNVKNMASIAAGQGRYLKQTEWRQPTDRGLLIDAVSHIIFVPDKFSAASTQWQPFDVVSFGGNFTVDGARHGPAGVSKQRTLDARYMNMLYCDGHAGNVSVREAWNAMHNPGYTKDGP
jgi:prepilin-type N-terminal cleavage/methylation domain-containing protein/prepilin-type processing-associated H-X9-DG protein